MTNYLRKKEKISFFERPISITFIIDALILLYTISIYLFSFGEENFISKAIALVLMGMLGLYLIVSGKFVMSKMTILLGLFTLFCFLSSFWAINADLAISRSITLLQIFVLCFLLYNYMYYEEKVDFFINVICWAGTVFAVYTVLFFGISEYFAGLEEGTRMGSEITNVNTIGLVTASSAIIAIWHLIYNRKILYILPTIICTIVALGSGSRKVLVLLALGILFLFVLKGNSKKRLISIIEAAIALGVFVLILQLPIFQTINERMMGFLDSLFNTGGMESSAEVRVDMIKYGMEYFKDDPFKGVGIGNSRYILIETIGRDTYLHNNYVELLASIGIFGTIIYYLMYLVPVPRVLKSAFKQNKYAIMALVLLIIQLVLQYAAVQYYSKTAYLYIILFFLVADKERTKKSDGFENKKAA